MVLFQKMPVKRVCISFVLVLPNLHSVIKVMCQKFECAVAFFVLPKLAGTTVSKIIDSVSSAQAFG